MHTLYLKKKKKKNSYRQSMHFKLQQLIVFVEVEFSLSY